MSVRIMLFCNIGQDHVIFWLALKQVVWHSLICTHIPTKLKCLLYKYTLISDYLTVKLQHIYRVACNVLEYYRKGSDSH